MQSLNGASHISKIFLPGVLILAGIGLINTNISGGIIVFLNEHVNAGLDLFYRQSGLYYSGLMLICGAVMLFISQLALPDQKKSICMMMVLAVSHLYILINVKQNTPLFDEYSAVLNFFCKQSKVDGWMQNIRIYFEPYYECKVPLPLFICSLVKLLPGQAYSFNIPLIINVFYLVAAAALLFRQSILREHSALLLPVLLLLILNAEYMISNSSSFSGLCYNGVLFFGILGIYFLQGTAPKKRSAFLFLFLAVYSFGNGLVWLFSALLVIISNSPTRKSLWNIILVLLLLISYFWNYEAHPLESGPFDLIRLLWFIPVFLGSSVQFFYTAHLPFIAGCFVLLVFAFAVYKRYDQKRPLLFHTLLFLVLTACLTAWLRHSFREEAPLRLRYGVFSTFALYTSLLIFIDLFKLNLQKIRVKTALYVFLVFNLMTGLFFYPETDLAYINNRRMIRAFVESGEIPKSTPYYIKEYKPELECALELGLIQESDY